MKYWGVGEVGPGADKRRRISFISKNRVLEPIRSRADFGLHAGNHLKPGEGRTRAHSHRREYSDDLKSCFRHPNCWGAGVAAHDDECPLAGAAAPYLKFRALSTISTTADFFSKRLFFVVGSEEGPHACAPPPARRSSAEIRSSWHVRVFIYMFTFIFSKAYIIHLGCENCFLLLTSASSATRSARFYRLS